MTFLQFTVRFLDHRYHGLLTRGGPPEWPPSPFRLFSALVAGVGRRGELDSEVGKSLEWLQEWDPPVIVAPRAKQGQSFIRHVPNNDSDSDKFRKTPEKCRTAKPTIPTLFWLEPDQKPEVHYLWDVEHICDVPFDCLCCAAQSLTTLGWGIDMAFAHVRLASQSDAGSLLGVRWHPKPHVWRDVGMLRVPTVEPKYEENTLQDLRHCHETMMARIESGKPIHTVDKPRVFKEVFYASDERPITRPHIVFELRKDDGSFFPYPQRQLMHIAGMVRCLAIQVMESSPPRGIEDPADWLNTYVRGIAPEGVETHRRFSYLPLPSIGHRHADQIVRRVMITAPIGDDHLLEHLARRLNGRLLVPERGDEFGDQSPPMLIRAPYSNKFAQHYIRPSNVWASVTPVILPGHDDHKPAKRHKLILKALRQSGIEQSCTFEPSAISSFPKSYSAHKYDRNKKPSGYLRPDHLLTQTAVHLQLRFNDDVQVPGPIAVGAGRHLGFGLLANPMNPG